MTEKEAAIQRLADAYAAKWPTDKPMMGSAPMVWLRLLARIAIEQGVVPMFLEGVKYMGAESYDLTAAKEEIPWSAVCPEDSKHD